MRVKVKYSSARKDFQVLRVLLAPLPKGLFHLTIDFSDRVSPGGLGSNGKTLGLEFDLEGQATTMATVQLIPEKGETADLIPHGQVHKRSYYAILVPRTTLQTLDFQEVYSEPNKRHL